MNNFTGPSGLILYFIVCVVSGKGLPPNVAAATGGNGGGGTSLPSMIPPLGVDCEPNAGEVVERLWGTAAGWSAAAVVETCAEGVIWEDLVRESGGGMRLRSFSSPVVFAVPCRFTIHNFSAHETSHPAAASE